jgi:RimJ/RimL family protein N-acetyltransferase
MTIINQDIKTLPLEKLSNKQASDFKTVLKEASSNKFLGGDEEEVIPTKRCIVILYGKDEQPVGFYTPKKQNMKGVDHWRAGTLFILKDYQGKGIMSAVLKDFFESHQPGLSWIEDTNNASIALFKSLGFKRDKARNDGDDHPGHWWVKPKVNVGTESYSEMPTFSW